MSRTWSRRVGMLACAVVLAGCGSSDAPTSGSSGASGEDGVGTAEADVAAALDIDSVELPMPSEPFDPGAKRVAIISVGQSTPLGQQWTGDALAAVESIGWESSVFDTALDLTKAATYISQATEQGYDAIILQSYDVNALKGPVDGALQQGIAIACMSCKSVGYEDQIHDVSPDWSLQGREIGAYIVEQSQGEATVLGFPDDAFASVAERYDAMEEYLSENCPGCTYEETSFTTASLGKPGPPEFTAALSQYPAGTITNMVAPYAPAGELFAKSAAQAGRDDFVIDTFDTAEALIDMTVSGDYPTGSSVVAPNEFMAWAAVDLVARELAGKETWDASNLPSPLLTADNASSFPGASFVPSTIDYKADFQSLWQGA